MSRVCVMIKVILLSPPSLFNLHVSLQFVSLFDTSNGARTHQVDGVSPCPTQVGHRCALDTVRHVFDTQSYVSHLKNIIFWLGHASDTTEYGSDTRRTWLGRASDTTGHKSNTTRAQPSTFFSNYLMDQKRIQMPKNPSSLRNFI